MTPRQRLLATLTGQPHDRVPVTPIVMAWGAHLIGRTYRDFYLDHRVMVAANVALAQQFHVDLFSTISDPWREADSYGMRFDYPDEGVGIPHDHLLHGPDDRTRLRVLDPMAAPRMRDRVDAVDAYRRQFGDTYPILGWVEGPIAQYADLRGVQDAMFDLIDNCSMFHNAAAILVDTAIRFARAQIDAGADIIGVGDAAASMIGPELYLDHVHPWQRKLFAAIHDMGAYVKLHICGDINALLPHLATVGADIIDCDHMVPLLHARQVLGDHITLCGNFDPVSVLKDSTPTHIAAAAAHCITTAGGPHSRFILQPGCEVPPTTPIDNMLAFCPSSSSS